MTTTCFFCDLPLKGEIFYLRSSEKAKLTIQSKVRRDKKYVKLQNSRQVLLHQSCFDNYSSWEKAICARKVLMESERGDYLGTEEGFQGNISCIFCGDDASDGYISKWKKNKEKYLQVYVVRDDQKLLELKSALEKINTLICKRALKRIQDLASPRYHQKCRRTHLDGQSSEGVGVRRSIGHKLFLLGQYILERREENQFNLSKILNELNIQMSTEFRDELKLFFADSLIYHSTPKRDNIILLSRKTIVNEALDSYWDLTQCNTKMVSSVAKKVNAEIDSLNCDNKTYPNPNNFLNNIADTIPPTLKSFLALFITDRRHRHSDQDERYEERRQMRINSICIVIVSMARPSMISPLLLSIGTLIYRKYGSSDLIDILYTLGFSSSYNDIQLLEASIIECPEKPLYIHPYIQLVFDNADHNTATIDGKNTFHVMGGIKIVTPHDAVTFDFRIPKLKKLPPANTFKNAGYIDLLSYVPPTNSKGLEAIKVEDLFNPESVDMTIQPTTIDFFWLLIQHASDFNFKGYKSLMEEYFGNRALDKSRVIPLPFVNNSPTDKDTIFTVLSYAQNISKDFLQKKIFVTFDQSLYIKARAILAEFSHSTDNVLDRVIVRLGGFHLQMSFMGSIGYTMAGSGIETVLSKIYAPNSISKILDGHYYSRSFRAYILLNVVLADLLLKEMQDNELMTNEELTFMNNLLNSDMEEISEDLTNSTFQGIYNKFTGFLDEVEKRGPTAKLWVQFFKMTTLVKQLEEAEKSSNWALHVQTVRKMIPFFHATGHNNYAESAHIYLQDILTLDEVLDAAEFDSFVTAGYFSIKRTEKHSCGVYSDQTIEQVLMKGIKSRGGFIKRAISQVGVSKWIGSNVALLDIINSLQVYCKVDFSTSEQHVEGRLSRIQTDRKHILLLKEYFESNNPFTPGPNIISLDTGLIGSKNVNCHMAYEKGKEILTDLVLKNSYFSALHLKKSNKVLPLSSMASAFKIDDEIVPADPNLVFRRILLSQKKTESLKDYIDYELAPFPASLFDGVGFTKTAKSKLYDLFTPLENYTLSSNMLNVIDGGFLLHRVVWTSTDTYQKIFDKYCKFIIRYKPCIVVFDGYPSENSTKSYERKRRATKRQSTPREFLVRDNACGIAQEDFLSNQENKKLLIKELTTAFQEQQIRVLQSEEDADRLIVLTAQEEAENYDSVQIVGEDIDLLVLLTQFSDNRDIVLNKIDRKGKTNTLYNCSSFKYSTLKNIVAFLHAFSGCDTTSAFYDIGKLKVFKILAEAKNEPLVKRADAFLQPETNPEILWQIALDIVSLMYIGKSVPKTDFNSIRLQCFDQLTGDKNVKRLPPTDYAVKEHAMRVYLQCQDWSSNKLNPAEWGWQVNEEMLVPIFTSKPLIPEKFIKQLNCGCKVGCQKRCNCIKLGLKCSIFCKGCKGRDCENSSNVLARQEFEENDDADDEWLSLEPEIILEDLEEESTELEISYTNSVTPLVSETEEDNSNQY